MVFPRNAEREARLLDEWRKGTVTAREAARKTGYPEGTVYYYWKRFNRDPGKANRLAASLKPRKKLIAEDMFLQSIDVENANTIIKKFNELIRQEKYPQAEYYIRAKREERHFRNELMANVNSVTAHYIADPENLSLIPFVVREMVGVMMAEGQTLPEAVENLQKSVLPFLPMERTQKAVSIFYLACEELKREHLAKQESREGEPSEKTADPEPSRPASKSDLIEPGVGKGDIPKKRMSFTELIESVVKHDEEELKRMTREAAAKGQKVTVRDLIIKGRPTPQPPKARLSEMRVDLDPEMKKKLSELHSDLFANRPTPGDMRDLWGIRPSQEPTKRRTTKETKESKSDDEKKR